MEETETQIRLIIKNEYLKGTSKQRIEQLVNKAINQGLKEVTIPNLKEAGRISLLDFARRQYAEIRRIRGLNLLVLLACIKISQEDSEIVKDISLTRAKSVINQFAPLVSKRYTDMLNEYDTANLYGVPLQKFSQDYINDNVKPVYERLAKQYPFDPASDQVKHINSLRNRAELEVRYTGHLENIENLKEQGINLVISSSHADCSERCRPFQNRVYSLNGTSGTAPDGRKYVPLEEATDIYYTTKSGKVWKNGLLGFNCRHYLVPYKDNYKFPKPNAKEEQKQYNITEEQRHLERNVRKWRTRAIYEKDTNKQAYEYAKKKAETWNKRYISFSKANGRAYYPSRTKVL